VKTDIEGSGRAARRRMRSLSVLSAGAILALGLAACGSSSSNSASTTTAASTATTAAGGTATTTGGSSGAAAAAALVQKLEVEPTSITDTVKINGPIPKGLTVDFIPCGANPECQQEGQIVAQGAALIGWKTNILPNDGSPQQSKAAFDTVVSQKAAGVLFTAIPLATFQSDVAALQANGTVVSACCETDPTGTGIDYNIDAPDQSAPVGQAQAAIVASDSKCTNAGSVIVNIPDFAILADGVKSFKSNLDQYCPGATVDELDIALANLGTAPATEASFMRAHPNDHYIVMATDGTSVGLPAALQAAGLSNSVKLVGQGATPTNVQYLQAGQELADTTFDYYDNMWAMLTAVIEKKVNGSVTPAVAPPLWILTKDNAPTGVTNAFPVVKDYQKQYEALWGISG